MNTADITPAPPIAGEELPHVGTGLRFIEAPTDYLAELRRRHGDTFFLDIFGFRLLMLFSAKGLESLYKLPEEAASFHQATFDLVGFKTPNEIFADAEVDLFYQLLANKRMPDYLQVITEVVAAELERWGDSGEVDIFDAIRTLEQRVGYGLWICPEAAAEPFWQQLKQQFDVLDQERAFVEPDETLRTIKTDKAAERAALAELHTLVLQIAERHTNNPGHRYATIDLLYQHFADVDDGIRTRKAVHNIVNVNQGFLSNLYAAIAWVVVNLLRHPDAARKVREEIGTTSERHGIDFACRADALNEMVWLEQVMMESVRLGQRSITLRKVLQPVSVEVEDCVYTVQPGVYIATMLSVTNTQTEDLQTFDPTRYNGNRLSAQRQPAGKETVSTFGHGRHACPAQRFSHHMCKIVISALLSRFELQASVTDARPSVRQLGGVARADIPIPVRFRRL